MREPAPVAEVRCFFRRDMRDLELRTCLWDAAGGRERERPKKITFTTDRSISSPALFLRADKAGQAGDDQAGSFDRPNLPSPGGGQGVEGV